MTRRPCIIGLLAGIASSAVLSSCGGGGREPAHLGLATPAGIGALRLGAPASRLRGAGLIGHLRRGCELDPGQVVAPLSPPLTGTAVFVSPRSGLSSLTIESGARTRAGIRIGSPVSVTREAYPGSSYDPPQPRAPISVGFLWVGRDTHPRFSFVIDPLTRRVIEIDIPGPNTCE
jgi:hypothetical protein